MIYLGRPCQYQKLDNIEQCKPEYWTNKRASREIIDSVNDAISKIKQNNQFEKIRLVGYSGGGTIASIISVMRDDVIDLRTVAGNLDINEFSKVHKISPLNGSLNPIDYANHLVNIPQLHLISNNDEIITNKITSSYLNSLIKFDVNLKCIKVIQFKQPTHSDGWENIWKNEKDKSSSCHS